MDEKSPRRRNTLVRTAVVFTLTALFVLIFAAISYAYPYAAPVSYPVGFSQEYITSADLDNDGDPDLITANGYSNSNMSILMNSGAGAFTAPVNYTLLNGPTYVTAADLDGDLDIDLVTANNSDNFGNNSVSVFLNNGGGTFAAPVYYSGITRPQTVVAVDLDGDGDKDLATGSNGGYSTYIMINNGNGTFANEVGYYTGSFPYALCAADLDGDGDQDLAVTQAGETNVVVLKNNGNGTFVNAGSYWAGSFPVSICSADFDNDGDKDIAIGRSNYGGVSVLMNSGTGTFAAAVSVLTAESGQSLITSDIDKDGDMDLVTAGGRLTEAGISLNNGAGTFGDVILISTGSRPWSMNAADFNGDGNGDLAAGNYNSTSVSILIGGFAADTQPPTVSSLNPADNSTGIGKNANLSVTFDESIAKGAGNIVIKKSSDGSVFEIIAVTSTLVTLDGTTATINPIGTLAESAGYYVEIANTAFIDGTGNGYAGISGSTTWNFTTGDFTAPTISSLSPADNAVGVGIGANLVINFNESVIKGTGNIIIRRGIDNSIAEAISIASARVTVSGSQVTIDPASDLASETPYYVQVDAGAIKDMSNNSFAGISDTTAWTFATADVINPTAVTFDPADNAVNVAPNTDLVVSFSENVVKGLGNIVIRNSADDSVFAIIAVTSALVTVTGTNVTINLISTLAESAGYYVEIANTAFIDGTGNGYAGISGVTTWSFATGDFTAPTISSLSPADNAVGVGIGANLVINFNESVFKGLGDIVIMKASDDSVFETIAVTSGLVTIDGATVTINPVGVMAPGTVYYVQIAGTAFADAADNSYAGIADSTTWNFTTLTAPPAFETVPGLSQTINIENGQVIVSNPYIIKVNPSSIAGIVKVEFYVDGVLIGTVYVPGADGSYSCAWDTSLYHSDISIVAYNALGETATLERSATVALEQPITELPYTGR